MIYIASDVVLADESGDFRPNGPLVGYRNLLTTTNITADEAAASFPASNLANPSTAEKWKGLTDAEQSLTVALASPQLCDYVGLARHNLGTIGCTVKVQTSTDGDVWTDLCDDFIPGDDAAIMVRFDQTTASYFRVLLTPDTDTVPELAVMYLGRLLVLQRNIYVGHTPITMSYAATVSVGLSESGEFLGRITRRANPANEVKQASITATWARDSLKPFYDRCQGVSVDRDAIPFFFAWRPTTFPNEVCYGWFPEGSPPTVSNSRPNGMMDAGFSIQAIL